MTERHLTESAIGLAGRLSYIPHGINRAEECGWRSSRNCTQNGPVVKGLGSCRTWIPAERNHAADSLPPPRDLWVRNRREHIWLLNRHPEASLGNQVLRDHLLEESLVQHDNGLHACLFSLGEMTDARLHKATGIPLLVTVTGQGNNTVRLARLGQETWTWLREPNIAVRRTELAREGPTLWIGGDVSPIRRVKCLVDLKRYNPTRWLAIQRESGTTILQPEYRMASRVVGLELGASHIAANPLFRLSNKQTGGSAHSDISFNPGTRANPPQLAIIDEQGFWSIWDVLHTKLQHRGETYPTLRICGHITKGVLEQLPQRDISNTRWHKIIWVGLQDDMDVLGGLDLDADKDESKSQPTISLQRSSSIVLCNSRQVRLMDLTAGVFLPDLVFCLPDSIDRIRDIQNARDPQYLYVLTSSKLFVVRAYTKPGAEWDKREKEWSILFSTPHFRNAFDPGLRLVITRGVSADQPTEFVFIHSSTNPWVNVLFIEYSKTDPTAIRCQANINGLNSLQKTVLNGTVRTLCINPIPIIVKAPGVTKFGRDLAEKQAGLYQIMALRSDMSLVSALCVSSMASSIRISMPNEPIGRRSKFQPRGKGLLQYLSGHDEDVDPSTSENDSLSLSQRYVKQFYEHISTIATNFNKARPARSSRRDVYEHNLFDASHQSIREGLNGGSLPLRTLAQLMPDSQEVPKHLLSAVEPENEIDELNNIHPSASVHILDSARPRLYLSSFASLREVQSQVLKIASSSSHHGDSNDVDETRTVAISEQIAHDLYLSRYGIGYRSLSGSQTQAATEEGLQIDSQSDIPSSPPTLGSHRSNSEAVETEDPAMTLLRAYTGTGNFVPDKKFQLLDKWNLDADPSDYAFDLDRSEDADASKLRRAKQTAREDRKRRRAQTILQLSQEPELPASQPNPDMTNFFSSQSRVASSQRQMIHSDPLHLMSQPSAGPFGRRPTKKAKRRGGF
ncbi:hypothetical protein F4777DRAFT_460683 [Nemania sp. FL0916]|nr:hypothetical protein F4777DRAFT_460683 [Nemania sp. FL0916]